MVHKTSGVFRINEHKEKRDDPKLKKPGKICSGFFVYKKLNELSLVPVLKSKRNP